MSKRVLWLSVVLGLIVSLVGFIPILTAPLPTSRWWLYLFALGVITFGWGAALLGPVRFRAVNVAWMAFSTLVGLLFAVWLGGTPMFH